MFRYFGTKASTSGYVADIVNELTTSGRVADAFGGLGTIRAELKYNGHQVTTCNHSIAKINRIIYAKVIYLFRYYHYVLQ